MVERRVLLIVLSISSILVLAGFSANEKASASVLHPPFGDFLCWFDESGEEADNSLLRIEDQFGALDENDLQAIFDGEIWEWIEYCTAVDKEIGEEVFLSPFSGLDQHYSGWSYPHDEEQTTIGPGTGISVIVDVPQFNQNFQTTLGFVDEIFVPANKTLSEEPFQVDSIDLDHHWNCYEMFGPSPGVEVNLVSQHGNVTGVVGNPFLFCAPMQKTDAGQTLFGSFEIPDHMVCYSLDEFDDSDIGVSKPDLPDELADQIEPDGVTLTSLLVEKLCVPAFKSFPVVGGSMIPIDTSALLLAGVQSISMWMIPVIVAGVGIGIFVIKRRK